MVPSDDITRPIYFRHQTCYQQNFAISEWQGLPLVVYTVVPVSRLCSTLTQDLKANVSGIEGKAMHCITH